MAQIPEVRDDDPDDIRQALTTAAEAWDRQSPAEALAWVQQAARVAAGLCADDRAMELFFAAAELADVMVERERKGSGLQAAAGRAIKQMIRGANFDDDGGKPEDGKRTIETPRTKLRKAMMEIDPSYADRVDFDTDPAEPSTTGDTTRRGSGTADSSMTSGPPREHADSSGGWPASGSGETSHSGSGSQTGSQSPSSSTGSLAPLQAYWVNLIAIPDDGDVRVLFAPPGSRPPEGVLTALLVPASGRDAELLLDIYNNTNAKI